MADGPCAKAELEMEEASKKYAEAVNSVRRLTSTEPKGGGAKRQTWEQEIAAARQVRDSALEAFKAKSDALQKCRSDHGIH